VKRRQKSRRAIKSSPDARTNGRQACAARAQAWNVAGTSGSIRPRTACAKTGDAPPVETPITRGERVTMDNAIAERRPIGELSDRRPRAHREPDARASSSIA
jgi:hypothetical protein